MQLSLKLTTITGLALAAATAAVLIGAAVLASPMKPDTALADPGEESLRAGEYPYRVVPVPDQRVVNEIAVYAFHKDVVPLANTMARFAEAGGGYVVEHASHGSNEHLVLHVPEPVFRDLELLVDERGEHVNSRYRDWAADRAGLDAAGRVPDELVRVVVDVRYRIFPTELLADLTAACGYVLGALFLFSLFTFVLLCERWSKEDATHVA